MYLLFNHGEDLQIAPYPVEPTLDDPVTEHKVSVCNIEIDEEGNVTLYGEPCGWYVVLNNDETTRIVKLWLKYVVSLSSLDALTEEC